MKLNNIYTLTSCPICNCSEYKILFRDNSRREKLNCYGSYVQCKYCTLVYLRERPHWEDIVKLYSILEDDITANTGNIDFDKLKYQVLKPISKWKKILRKIRFRPHSWPLETVSLNSKRLLDIGCGNGAKCWEFFERGYEMWGVDVSIDAINLCKQLIPTGHFIRGELQEISLPDNYFDYIRIDNVLEHVPKPYDVLKICSRYLKKGGQILIYVPHGRSFTMRFMKGNSISSWIPFHLQLFTHKSLKWLMNETGYTDIHIYEYYPTSWLPLSIMQWRNKGTKFDYPAWLTLLCYPIGWLLSKLQMGEELVGVGIKK